MIACHVGGCGVTPFDWNQDVIGQVFFATWIVLVIAGVIFHFTAPPAWKQKVWTYATVGVGLLFLAFVYLLGGLLAFYFAAIPVGLITCLNLTTVKFCPQCGALNRSPFIFPVPKFCNKCGSDLDASTEPDDDSRDLRNR